MSLSGPGTVARLRRPRGRRERPGTGVCGQCVTRADGLHADLGRLGLVIDERLLAEVAVQVLPAGAAAAS